MFPMFGQEGASLYEPAVDVIRQVLTSVAGASSFSVAANTPVRAALLQAWQMAAMDPDVSVPKWLLEGTPAGISHDMSHDGIFPPLDNESSRCPI